MTHGGRAERGIDQRERAVRECQRDREPGVDRDLDRPACGSTLADVPLVQGPAALLGIIESGTAAFGTYSASSQPAQNALADIRAIGGRVLADLPAATLASLVPSDIAEEHLTPAPGSRLASRDVERPCRFAAASSYPSLGAAASGLGLNTFTLVAQINRIERELGGPLLVRAERGRPMTLTPLGRKVLRAIRTLQCDAQP